MAFSTNSIFMKRENVNICFVTRETQNCFSRTSDETQICKSTHTSLRNFPVAIMVSHEWLATWPLPSRLQSINQSDNQFFCPKKNKDDIVFEKL